MKESNLLKIAFVCSILGVFLILIVSESKEIPSYEISDLTSGFVEKTVSIQGKISAINLKSDFAAFTLTNDNSSIKVVAFPDEQLSLKKGDSIEVQGKVEEYQGELQVNADLIKRTS